MNLPNADGVEIAKQKITDYLLNPLHPDGAGKAARSPGNGLCRRAVGGVGRRLAASFVFVESGPMAFVPRRSQGNHPVERYNEIEPGDSQERQSYELA